MTTALRSSPVSIDTPNLCPACTRWCATSEEQLANRLRNMERSPETEACPCRRCGSTDWVTTRAMIVPPQSRWRRFFDWWQGPTY